jgi:hypothetical protein
MASPHTRTVSAVSVVNVFACAWFVHLVDHSQCRRAGVFIKAPWAALGRPVELLARAEALLALEPELEVEEGLGLPCTPKKSRRQALVRPERRDGSKDQGCCRRGGKCFVPFTTPRTARIVALN